jgi:hypothetical protein
MGLRPTQRDENGFCSATDLHRGAALPFVIPSAAEGSAVQRTFPGNVFVYAGFLANARRKTSSSACFCCSYSVSERRP